VRQVAVDQLLQPVDIVAEDFRQVPPENRIQGRPLEAAEEDRCGPVTDPAREPRPQRRADAYAPGPQESGGGICRNTRLPVMARHVGREGRIHAQKSEQVRHERRRIRLEVLIEVDANPFAWETFEIAAEKMVIPTAPQVTAEGHIIGQRPRQFVAHDVGKIGAAFQAVAAPAQEMRVRTRDRLPENGDQAHVATHRMDACGRAARLEVHGGHLTDRPARSGRAKQGFILVRVGDPLTSHGLEAGALP